MAVDELDQQLSNLGVFERKEGRLYFSHDISLLEKGKYKLAGSFVAWSILHGGPGFSRLHPTLYDMMVGRKTEEDIQIDDVIDGDVSSRLNMIKNATSDRMVADAIATMGDWAANNGCSGIYTMTLETKEDKIRILLKQHLFYRCKAEIDQFQQGLEAVGGFWGMVVEDPGPLRSLFTSYSKY
ncbi:G2/M phase-specific E3 ubiquitin-protein ligase [Apostichopus japonicus]|uniref:G2/M phase-specific E3 ubiquitin-protein ligase n=1 Tax=Stichopus japonicus TaxID=307972 RepID=A0A2G8KP73_STIJA|nr:G2/M phase-specific E3 ubiquitin-protein ligase [Apostichopus japonicus]